MWPSEARGLFAFPTAECRGAFVRTAVFLETVRSVQRQQPRREEKTVRSAPNWRNPPAQKTRLCPTADNLVRYPRLRAEAQLLLWGFHDFSGSHQEGEQPLRGLCGFWCSRIKRGGHSLGRTTGDAMSVRVTHLIISRG